MGAQPQENAVRDETWYVAIIHGGGALNAFIGAGGETYRHYSERAKKYGTDIVAEKFQVDDLTVNVLTGFDQDGRRVSREGPLKKLVDALNSGEQLNPQEELDRLCSAGKGL